MKHYLYILISESSGKYYIGISKNPENRLINHNTTEKGFTSRYRPWKIVLTKEFPNKYLAGKEERRLKKLKNKKKIEEYIRDNS
ncbi:MAG TPA: excinuclease ABC subunit C [Bacteroidetes bacterium]|nr:excinuclease ABC subunit C [Bacteroidota bacterium]HCN37419.1 excinuclease ABC subunit C [Bacteroidota bacterium]